MFCSVLIPTRKRFPRLINTIRSIYETAKQPQDIEIVLRIDDDDGDTIANLESLNYYKNIVPVIGSRYTGYMSMGVFATEAARAATGQWCLLLDDDCTLEGRGWDDLLRDVPSQGHIAWCEFYHLGFSEYGSDSCGPVGPFFPNNCWKQLGYYGIGNPADDFFKKIICDKHGWKRRILRGITLNHQRDNDEELSKHRA